LGGKPVRDFELKRGPYSLGSHVWGIGRGGLMNRKIGNLGVLTGMEGNKFIRK